MTGSERSGTPARRQLVGREPELAALGRLLEEGGSVTCLVLAGEAGIGKTTLWEAGLETAQARGYLVLSARSSEAEVELPFAAMSDILEAVEPGVLASLPGPQLNALEVALRKRAPVGAAPDAFAISAGLLSALRALAQRRPLLVAIDDIQWLDHSSANALLFAARRLSESHVRFLITRRSGRLSDFERITQPFRVEQLDIAPLSFGATSRVLLERYGNALTRRVLRRVHEVSQGNPLFALELGRLLTVGGMPDIGTEMPFPDLADEVFRARVSQLPDPVRRTLLAVALSAGMSRSELATVVDPLALDDAIASGLLVLDGLRVRPTHPMFAAAAKRQSTAGERQDLHLDLASAVSDPIVRARHLAIATASPDASLAQSVADAAEIAAKRGAVEDAEELGTHALRLTPPDAPQRTSRLLALGRFHVRADGMSRLTDLLSERMDELSPGRDRAMAHLLLGEAADLAGDTAHAELALAEAPDDLEVRALALAKKSRLLSQSRVERIDEAEAWAAEAVSAAQRAGTEVQDRARTALLWTRILRGRPIDFTPSRLAESHPWSHPESSIDRPLAARLAFRGEVDEARRLLRQVRGAADENGDVQSSRLVQQMLCETELRAGNTRDAARLLDELDDELPWMPMIQARLRAVLAAVVGDPLGTAKWAATVLEPGCGDVQGWERLEATRAVGLAALLEQDTARAVENLRAVWDHTLREHVDDPGAFPVAADLVEALVLSGDTRSANDVTERLQRSGAKQHHPWGLASGKRSAAAVRLAESYVDEAATALDEAAADYRRLGLYFDRARTLLFLGVAQRRYLKRAAARESLEEATSQFELCGCSGWAARGRSELARVSGRRSAPDETLTPSERRVVDLAVSGLSNKEIAGRLVVSVSTVEAHLSHAFAKLGVRSRTQLARLLSTEAQ